MACSQCELQKASEQRFCGYCGSFLHQPLTADEKHICELCATELLRFDHVNMGDYATEQFRHCRRCGTEVETLQIVSSR